MKRPFLLIIIAVITLFGISAHANIIVNGSFEELPNALGSGSWTTYASIPGWTATYGSIEVRNDVAGVAQDGDIFVELDSYGNSSMSQTVITSVGALYTLSYYYAPRQGVAATSNEIELYFNSVLLGSVTDYSSLNNAWVQKTYSVIGTGSDVIRFAAAGTTDSVGGSIDNVSMETASVPEPVTLMLLGLGLLGLAGVKRKFAN